MAAVEVRRVVACEPRSIMKMLALPPCCRLMTMRWPSGEKRGEEVMSGKLPTTWREPVSRLIT